jgi:UDP-GlcNAc3NAcA epimerase
MLSRAILAKKAAGGEDIQEFILHTGQHYDACMSEVFFADLNIPQPAWRLDCAGGSHGRMTGRMLEGIEEILVRERPQAVIVYGDTNSTLAGALAASKLHIATAHVEAGLRSYNRCMPEEINRVLTDHVSSLLLCPTRLAVRNLGLEGIVDGVHLVGDLMYDAALLFGSVADEKSDALARMRLQPRSYRLCTLHRAENVDEPDRLAEIFRAILNISSVECPTIIPLHPRTELRLKSFDLYDQILRAGNILRIIPPASFIDMAALEKNALCILTDSGGVQKEAYFHRTPCITLRNETEWVETLESGWNVLAGNTFEGIIKAISRPTSVEMKNIDEYGDGHAAEAIAALL